MILNFFRELLNSGWQLMKNVLMPLAESVLVLLELIAEASETNAAIKKKMFGSGMATVVF